MKKVLILILTMTMMLTIAACGGNQTEATQPVTEAPATEPSGEITVGLWLEMKDVYAKLGTAAQLPEMIELNESLMLDYCGIAAEDVQQAVVVICADSLRTDEIWLLEAVDEAAAEKLAGLANKRLEKKGEESITYSPEQYAVVEKAKLLQNGCYLALIVSPDVDTLATVVSQELGI